MRQAYPAGGCWRGLTSLAPGHTRIPRAAELSWFRPWDQDLEWNPPWVKWFLGGSLNASYNCLDQLPRSHLLNDGGDKVAFCWEGEPGDRRTITYLQLYEDVCRFANGLKALGLQRGDRVALYLGMLPNSQ